MKIDRLETHDRYKIFTSRDSENSKSIGECVQDIVDQRPFGNHPFYIFSHARTDDDGVTKRLIHHPRLSKPRAESNSILTKVYPGSDLVKVFWMIPAEELWKQYEKGNVTECYSAAWSIFMFKNKRHELELREPDDLSDEVIDKIYRDIAQEAQRKKRSKIVTLER
jgi:hypothetical protein